ncbi:hypothetical protein WOLCODRAFT_22050 [Wolfiporia cocos MD-104 SS10]|uniref:Uncharacterized protein n=1 Tax=Wolfiporia cocos (strain MD-104) TaxID=742152 RepID=A0A2H3IUV5_WOLCO|nr:hypothetical protein WOLCODRAFT_22050 [Wolfiporia cocos MD-104 SS10]
MARVDCEHVRLAERQHQCFCNCRAVSVCGVEHVDVRYDERDVKCFHAVHYYLSFAYCSTLPLHTQALSVTPAKM